MSPDEERLQRYLEWRRAGDRDRAERRRRVIGYTAVPAVFLLVVGLATWFGRPSSLSSPTQSPVTRLPHSATSEPPTASQPETTLRAPAPPTVERPAARARPPARSAPRIASRPGRDSAPSQQPVREAPVALPTVPDPSADVPDVAAGVGPAAVVPPASDGARETPPAPRPDAWTRSRADVPAPVDVRAEPTSPAPPPPSDVVPAPSVESTPAPPPGGAVAVAPPTVRERVTTWAKGEVDEFRDGVKREVRNFRSGYDKVRSFFGR